MQVQIGVDKAKRSPVILDTQTAVNGHLQIAGGTGVGKTYQIRQLVDGFVRSASAMRRPIRFHVFDPHGDLDLPFASEVKFSEATPYGYNPFEINPDRDFGGVNRAIQKFISSVQKHKTLGTKQEAVLRYLLEDLYASKGFFAHKPESWVPDDPAMVRAKMAGKENRLYLDVKYVHKDAVQGLGEINHFKNLIKTDRGMIGGYDDELKCWWVHPDYYEGDLLMWQPKNLYKTFPSIDELVRFAEVKLKAQYCGTNNATIALLEDVNKAASNYHRKLSELAKKGATSDESEINALDEKRIEAKDKAVAAFDSYLEAIKNGRELDEVIRYGSTEVLKSVYERLQNLRAIRIFQAEPPPFNPQKPVWRYNIKPLQIPVQIMLVDLVCNRLFERAVQRGVQDDVVEVIIIDEGKRYKSDEPGNILDTISNEARKFGQALWLASQSPTHFNDDFLKATGTIIILGLAEADANVAERKLGIDPNMLSNIQPHKTALVQLKNKGQLNSAFKMVELGSSTDKS